MDLRQFSRSITIKFNNDNLLSRRLASAEQLAEKYDLHPPALILMFTRPEFVNLPLQQRCDLAGITAEEFLICADQDGFKRFIADYKQLMRDNLDVQSLEKLSNAVNSTRIITDRYGDKEDFSIEARVLDKPNQINVNDNREFNVFEQARQELLNEPVVVSTVESSTKTTDTP